MVLPATFSFNFIFTKWKIITKATRKAMFEITIPATYGLGIIKVKKRIVSGYKGKKAIFDIPPGKKE